MNETKIVPNE